MRESVLRLIRRLVDWYYTSYYGIAETPYDRRKGPPKLKGRSNMAANLVAGSIVQLKSGGPHMTVLELYYKDPAEPFGAKCAWFDVNDDFREHDFVVAALELKL